MSLLFFDLFPDFCLLLVLHVYRSVKYLPAAGALGQGGYPQTGAGLSPGKAVEMSALFMGCFSFK